MDQFNFLFENGIVFFKFFLSFFPFFRILRKFQLKTIDIFLIVDKEKSLPIILLKKIFRGVVGVGSLFSSFFLILFFFSLFTGILFVLQLKFCYWNLFYYFTQNMQF
eukprot:TRINITY_DN10340_c1_g1_i2.p1 TRINITY_DN10340_c1_g1~~TRINITY_DN10340_c1_g1_i2.p1  ORF type:complete len:107 (+),score=4.52 TRINITY_DN10340_c1_g1_i2:52-372(+)